MSALAKFASVLIVLSIIALGTIVPQLNNDEEFTPVIAKVAVLEKATLLKNDSAALLNSLKNLNDPTRGTPLVNSILEPLLPPLDKSTPKHLGLILPHHLIASEYIESAYRQLVSYNPDLVVLLSPNHQKNPTDMIYTGRRGLRIQSPEAILISEVSFSTPFTTLFPGYKATDVQLAKEHGITHHLPFIATFNEAEILPLVLARNVNSSQGSQLAHDIDTLIQSESYQRVLWIGSIDFSHYLPAQLAYLKDLETIKWIETSQITSIMNSTDSHLDAPSVLALLLHKFPNRHLLFHSNSANLMGFGFEKPGTSYMIYQLNDQ